MVSPSRLIKIRPISLFEANVSSGMGRGLAAGPEYTELRKVIWTSADAPLVSTLDALVQRQSPVQSICMILTEDSFG